MKTKLKYLLVLTVLVGFTLIGVQNLRSQDHKVKLQEIQLKDTSVKLKSLNQEYDDLLQQKTIDKEKVKQLEEEKKKLEEQLQAKLQKQEADRIAIAEAQKKLVNTVTQTKPVAAAPRVSYGGSCAEWIAAAGISDVANANELIRRESGCNPNARNPSSGACGVAQELPCGKSGCSMGDGACQVKWMNGYVLGRYGSWAKAVSFHNANNWY